MTRSIYSQRGSFTLKLYLGESFWGSFRKASRSFQGSCNNENAITFEKADWQTEQIRAGKSENVTRFLALPKQKDEHPEHCQPKNMVFVSMFAKGVIEFCIKSNQKNTSNNSRFSRSCQSTSFRRVEDL